MAIDRGIIDQQLQALGESPSWWERRELRDLPAVMHANEQIHAIARGKLPRRDPFRRFWLIVVTDQRLLCLRSSSGAGWRQLDVDGDLIRRTALRIGPFRARVLVTAGGQTYKLRVTRADGYKLWNALSRLGSQPKEALSGFGPAHMVRRVIDHVLDLPAAALSPVTPRPLPAPERSNERVESLEHEVDELRNQVKFLEQLLQEKHMDFDARLPSG